MCVFFKFICIYFFLYYRGPCVRKLFTGLIICYPLKIKNIVLYCIVLYCTTLTGFESWKEGIQKTNKKTQTEAANSKARADRVKESRKRIIEQQENELTKKRKELDQSRTVVQSTDFYGENSESSSGGNIGELSCSTAR